MELNRIKFCHAAWMTILVLFASWNMSATPTRAQSAVPVASREQILKSERWQRTQRKFSNWLQVQSIYEPDEVAAIRADLEGRVAQMSPAELDDFLKDMEERLEVLTSPEAEDARAWLEQFMAVARNPEQQLGMSRPDVLNMTASQVRLELQRLQQIRDSRLQAQAAFDRSRGVQAQVARDAQAARQAKRAPTSRTNWPANQPRPRNQNVQRRDPLPPPFRPPVYTIGPWGNPIMWPVM